MKKPITATFCLTLMACASHVGNYAKVSDAVNVQMADDSASEMVTLYPPALTHITLSQSTKDAYGVELLKKLHESGYAIEGSGSMSGLFAAQAPDPKPVPSKPDWSKNKKIAKAPETIAADSTPATPSNNTITYIVDSLDVGLYRVTLTIDSHKLSRVYRAQGNGIAPAGSWTLKE